MGIPENGCSLVAVHTHFAQRREGGEGSSAVISIPDAFAGERRDVVVEIRVPASTEEADSGTLVMRAHARYNTVCGRSVVQTPVANLEVQRSAEPECEPDAEVVAQRHRVEVTNALEQAIAQGEQGRFDEARGFLEEQASQLRCSKGRPEVTRALIEEVEDAQSRLTSASSWQMGGR